MPVILTFLKKICSNAAFTDCISIPLNFSYNYDDFFTSTGKQVYSGTVLKTILNASIKTCPFHLVPQVKKPYLILTLGRSEIHSVQFTWKSIERLVVIVTGTSTTTLLMLWMLMAMIRGSVELNKRSKTTCLRLGSLRDCFL